MKIGILLGKLTPDTGGAFSFTDAILKYFDDFESPQDTFSILYYSTSKFSFKKKTRFISIGRRYFIIRIRDEIRSVIFRILSPISKIIANPYIRALANRFNLSYLDRLMIRYSLDILWMPASMKIKISSPYIFNVWDLGHRTLPFFPEVNSSGWTWEERDHVYLKMIPKATYVTTGNESGRKEICKFYNYDEEFVRIIPFFTPQFALNPINDDISKIRNEVRHSENYFFYPAQFWPHKNHVNILYALKFLKEKGKDGFQVVFTGADKGNLSYVLKMAKQLNIEERIKYLGFVSREEMVFLYKNAIAVIFMSFMGPNNLPPLEAMALGCPAIVSDIKGHREQFQDCALFAKPADFRDIADKMVLIKENEQIRKDLITKGMQLAHSLTIENYIKAILNICHDFEPYRRCWSNAESYIHK